MNAYHQQWRVIPETCLQAPVITIPAGTDSADAVLADLGQLALSNALSWHGGEGTHDKKVLYIASCC